MFSWHKLGAVHLGRCQRIRKNKVTDDRKIKVGLELRLRWFLLDQQLYLDQVQMRGSEANSCWVARGIYSYATLCGPFRELCTSAISVTGSLPENFVYQNFWLDLLLAFTLLCLCFGGILAWHMLLRHSFYPFFLHSDSELICRSIDTSMEGSSGLVRRSWLRSATH